MNKRQYSLLYRLYQDGRYMPYNNYLNFLFDVSPRTLQALKQDYRMNEFDVYTAVWSLRTPPSTLGKRTNGQGYYAAKGSRSCLLDFYQHNGSRLVRAGWLRPQDRLV